MKRTLRNIVRSVTRFFEREYVVAFSGIDGKGKGFRHKGEEYVHHSDLPLEESAFFNLLVHQKLAIAGVLILAAMAVASNWFAFLVFLFSFLTVLYFLDLLFGAFMIFRTFSNRPEIKVGRDEIALAGPYEWPTYTIFCPLYREWQVVPQFVDAMKQLDYPKEKLEIIFLLEENDEETIEKVHAADLPPYFRIVIVPHSKPKTKPKAMNYGLQFAAGEYLVIYDAEDKPEPDQLKKAVLSFRRCGKDVVCVQAKLNFYNPRQNVLTRLFTAEYSLWFDLVLPGLQSISAPIPLGGTSNHFRTSAIKSLHGWDAFNVTEDCDLGMRLARKGYRTEIIDSTTHEEANSNIRNWINQRSRWIKGYIITYFVHMREPLKTIQNGRWRDLLFFQFVVGGKVTSLFINPIMWLITISYFLFRSTFGAFIESLFPGPVYYIGVFSFLFGNFLYLYYYMIGCAHRKQEHLIKYVFLVPIYWLGMSVAAWKALYEVVVRPHYWAKTRHGLHLEGAKVILGRSASRRRSRLAFLASGASMYVASAVIANVCNLIFNIYLGRELSLEEFGTVTLINTLAYLLNIFTGALGTTVTRTVSFLEGRQDGSGSEFYRKSWIRVFISGVIAGIAWFLFAPTVAAYFQVENQLLLISIAPMILVGALASSNRGYLQGILRFRDVALVTLLEVAAKLSIVVFLVTEGNTGYAAIAIPGSMMLAWMLSAHLARRASLRKRSEATEWGEERRFPVSFYFASLISGVSTAAFLSIDVILAKHYLSATAAGEYALLSLVGKMVFFFGSLLNVFVVTIVSRSEGKGNDPSDDFRGIFAMTSFLTIAAFLGLWMGGGYILPLLLGKNIIPVIQHIPLYAFGISLFTLSSAIVLYHLSRKHYRYSAISFVASLAMTWGIVADHASVESLVNTITVVNLAYFVVLVILHFFALPISYAYRNLRDALLVVRPLPGIAEPAEGKMRILIFNWRDLESVFAGGAETYIQTLARRFVSDGHAVTLFCSNDGRQTADAVVNGVRIVRRGGFFGVYVLAVLYYHFKFRGRVDVIVDCENGIPFFTPLYAKEPVYCLLHHVHQEVFRTSLPWPLAVLAATLEGKLMPLVYRNSEFITVSESSRREMMEHRITDKRISVVYPGIDPRELCPGEEAPFPLVSYVGRLKDYKSVDLLIRAFADIAGEMPDARLAIAGDGNAKNKLERLTNELGLSSVVTFTGKVTEEEKVMIMQTTWVFVNPSMIEGWGITTIEANACGTAVVASDVPGLRESVRDGVTGTLVPYGDIARLAEEILILLKDSRKRKGLAQNALQWASEFDWQKSAERFATILSSPKKISVAGFPGVFNQAYEGRKS